MPGPEGLAGRFGEPGEALFLYSDEKDYAGYRAGKLVTRLESEHNTPPMRIDKSFRGRFIRSCINTVYRSSEASAFSTQRVITRLDDLADRYRREAYALRRSILVGVSADELGRWAAELATAGSGSPEASVRAMYEQGRPGLGPGALRHIVRDKGITAFDSAWIGYLAAQDDLLAGASKDLSRADKNFADVRDRLQIIFDEAMTCVKKDAISAVIGLPLWTTRGRPSYPFWSLLSRRKFRVAEEIIDAHVRPHNGRTDWKVRANGPYAETGCCPTWDSR
jgi:preprotein translocase subunit SecA